MSEVRLEFAERTLASGLTCVALRNPGVATFAVTLGLHVGQRDEADGEHGVAYLVGSCLEEGTRHRSSVELAEAIEAIGGSLDAAANGATIQCPADEAAKAVKLVREVSLEPAFAAREVRRVQQEVLAEIEAEDADPRSVARRTFLREVYGSHPSGRPSYGDPKAVATYRPSDLQRFHKNWFVPHDGIVAAAGPASAEETLDLLVKAFRPFRGPPRDHVAHATPAVPTASREIHLPMEREQVHVYAGHVGIRREDPDFIALLVMDHVLGSGPGFTSRITQRLRDEMGLCYSVHASITSGAGLEPSAFAAYIGTSAEHRIRAVEVFREEIHRIRDTLPTEQELQDVKDYLTGSYVFGLERNSNLVGYAVRAKRYGLGYDFIHRYPELVTAVTRDDVRHVARTHLHPDNLIVVSAGAT